MQLDGYTCAFCGTKMVIKSYRTHLHNMIIIIPNHTANTKDSDKLWVHTRNNRWNGLVESTILQAKVLDSTSICNNNNNRNVLRHYL